MIFIADQRPVFFLMDQRSNYSDIRYQTSKKRCVIKVKW